MIYYVEDDDNIRELVRYTLTQMGLETKGFMDAAAFYAALGERLPDAVLLDVMLPGEDGMSILKRLRAGASTKHIPIAMLTAKDSEFDKVMGLDGGADDYIVKPFGMAELAARVRALLRRGGARESADKLVYGALTLDTAAYSVRAGGEEIALTLKEYELLKYLMENHGVAFTREKLLDKIWDYGYIGGTRTVDVHVQTLRAKLGDCGGMIETVRGVGYRFGGMA